MSNTSAPISVLIADDQTLMRNGLETMLTLEPDIKVVGTAENGKQAYQLAEEKQPDVLLLDVKMPVMDGIETLKRLKQTMPHIKVIILTMFDDEQHIIEALTHGADGFLLKEMSGDELINAIKKVVKGQILLPTSVAAKIATMLHTHPNDDASINEFYRPNFDVKGYSFSKREQEIIALMYLGYTNKQISEKLFITEGTVKNYISNIYTKIGVNNRAKAILQLKKLMSS
jgi:DNA-binding NarL/FixJ family response regulator